MQINVKTDIKGAIKQLNRVQRKQIPFAASVALNKTAEFAATNLNNDTRKYLDKPTRFTQNSFTIQRSSKRKLVAVVLAKPIQDQYLRYQVFGGTRRPKRSAIPVPWKNMRLNQYGNMPRGRIKKLLARSNVFSGVAFGIAGIWERGHHTRKGRFVGTSTARGTSLRLLAAWEPRASYTPLFPYQRLVNRYATRAIVPFFDAALKKALATAR